jgi:CheY-like chemotaxis protein
MVSVGTLAAGVAHEINSPLAYVVANLSFIADGLSQPQPRPAKELLQVAREAQDGADRVRKIVRDLKTFSRDADERVGPVDIAQVIDASANLAWNEVRHRARLVKDLEPGLPAVLGNESRLAQVFLNLIVNAAQAIAVGAADRNEIRVSARALGSSIEVRVTDTGPGIPPALQRRIFDPFFTTKPTGEGTGLGLYICQNIIRGYGGRISLTSVEGEGATFIVELPAAAQPVAADPQPAPPSPAPRRGRILVVDDEAFVVGALQRLLAVHEVVGETEAASALERLRAGEQFDVILCDLMMPRLSGMDFHAALMQDAPAQAAKIIFMTGGAFTPAARDFLENAPNVHIQKPFDAQTLRTLVADRVGR